MLTLSPLGSGLYCKTQKNLLDHYSFEDTWALLKDYVITYPDEFGFPVVAVEYQDRNVRNLEVENDDAQYETHLIFHRYVLE